jgi:hypothetical protein
MQERIRDVVQLLKQFPSSKVIAEGINDDEVQAFWEERLKIERLAYILSVSNHLGFHVDSDLEFYSNQENFEKQSSRMQHDERMQMVQRLSNDL